MSGWLVYLLRCADDTYYCGVTNNLAKRLARHNGLCAGGAKYTRTRRPVILLATTPVYDRREAQKLEARIKSLSRKDKLAFFLELAHA